MTFFDFFSKYNGKTVDVDGSFGGQCMDLMHRYLMDIYGLDAKALAAPAAKDVFLRFPNVPAAGYFQKINNLPWNVPKQGDIVFWGPRIGPYGHVAIYNSGGVFKFTSFDQNWGADKRCRLVEHNYTGVLGWLRFKGV